MWLDKYGMNHLNKSMQSQLQSGVRFSQVLSTMRAVVKLKQGYSKTEDGGREV